MLIYDLGTLRFLDANEVAVRYYGYSRAKFRKMYIWDISSGEDLTRIKTFARAKRQKFQYSGASEYTRPDGTISFVEITSHKLSYRGHKAAWIVIKDVTESSQNDSRAIEAERHHRREAETLQRAAAALTSTRNVDEILASLLEGLSQAIPYSTCAVLIKEGDELRVVSAYGYVTLETWIGHSYRIEGSMAKYILEGRRPLILADAEADPRFKKWDDSVVIRGWMGVPLIVRDEPIGCLTIDSAQPDTYTNEHADIALAFANQAAIAIENARLFQDAMRYAQRWATLHAASQELARVGEDLEQVYISIHKATTKLLPANTFAITLTDDKRTIIEAVYLFDQGKRSQTIKIPFGSGFISEVITNGTSIKLDDDRETSAEAAYLGTSRMARSILIVPLRVSDNIIGAISVQSHKPNVYSSEDQLLLELLAAQAAIAIVNTRLFEDTRRNAEEFKALYQMTHAVSKQANTNLLLQTIVERAAELLNSPVSGFYLYDAVHRELELSFFIGVKLPTGTRLRLGEGAAGQVALNPEPLIIKDYKTWEGRSRKYEGIPFRAVLDVPMLYGGELIGVLAVNELGESERQYTEDDANLLSLFAAHAASAVHSARLFNQLEERVEQLSILHWIDTIITSSTDLHIGLQAVLESMVRLLKLDSGSIFLYNPDTLNLEFAGGVGLHSKVGYTVIHLGDDLAGRVASTRQMLEITDLSKVELSLPYRQMIEREQFLSYRCIPLMAKGELKGVLELYHRSPLPSDPAWNNLFNLLAGQAAIAIDNAMLFSNLERANTELELAYDATIEGWSRALELRDYETSGHTRRVVDMTLALARKIGVPDYEIPNIRRGALLHDIGKMGVPDDILLKPGPLTEEEWKIMRQHPQNAYNLLSKIAYLHAALDIPYCHHEKWDGSGYPRGLKGEQIPLYARMFAVVDVYDGLSYDRPYRSAWPKEKVIDYIKAQSGEYFDPSMAEAFLKII
jgi:PAS domain S-box-containing protein